MRSLPLVLHVLSMDLGRGAQRYARALCDALEGRGAEHRILTLFESGDRAIGPDIALSVPARGRRAGLVPRVLPSLLREIRRLKPKVIVAHGSEPLKYLALLPLRTTIIYYKIGIATDAARVGPRRALHAVLQRRARWVAGVSQECLDEARRVFGVPPEKLVLIPNGRDPGEYRPPDLARTAGPPAILFVGRLVPGKHPELFVEVARRIRQRGVSLTARMVGDGPLRTALGASAAAAGVELLGARDDVPDLLREADVLVFTSEPSGEGMPGVFVEAGLSGVPVVTTDVPGARTVVEDGVTGYVVATRDPEALAERVATLVTDGELRREMGRAARARCAEEFSLEASVRRWETLLSRALA